MATQPEVGVADFVLIDNLTIDTFVENLHLRFKHNKIYSYIGEVLVSVNPYRPLELYGAQQLAQYRGRDMFEVAPHVYAVAEACQRMLRQQGHDTCVLISGESGAGKTEASKYIMKYIAANTTQQHREYIDRVKNVLIQSTCILETFGNAKTNRNDNSSRFGKYMDIHFDHKGDPVGGHVSNYLLEKSRVVHVQPGERNFHAFYQLLAAPSAHSKRTGLSVGPGVGATYVTLGGAAPTEQDVRQFGATCGALAALGFTQEKVRDVWDIVAGVLLLAELTFTEDAKGELKMGGPVKQCIKALGITEEALRASMSGRVLSAGGDLVHTRHSDGDVTYTQRALGKAAYDRLFTWVVSEINKAIEVPSGTHRNTLIGVLDIYGFEIFDTNSFEQFCINYCNEKLQQLFIELVLKQEQEEYQREGITWSPVKYFNNRLICDMIDAPHLGVIAVMDEAALNPTKISDSQLLTALDARLRDHAHYTSRQLSPLDKSLRHGRDFRITHYAGDVTYCIDKFMDKNKDALWQDLKRLLHSSTNRSLSDMWPEGGDHIQKTSKRPPSAASLFRSSMSELVTGLLTKTPFYVRCIKPNGQQTPGVWDDKLVRHQSAYLGLVENVRVRRAGFAARRTYEHVLRRYKMLSQYTWPNYRGGTERDAVAVLMRDLGVDDVQYGHTKLFVRSARTLQTLETARTALLPALVLLLQKVWRGGVARRRCRRLRAAWVIYRAWRRYRYRCYISSLQSQLSRNKNIIRRWPESPKNFPQHLVQASYRRWRAYLVLKPIPRDQWEELKMKLCCASALRGRRVEWGAGRRWSGDYLRDGSVNTRAALYKSVISNLQKSQQIGRPLFSCKIHKFNKHNKSSERCLLITDKAIYKLDADTFKPLKKPTLITELGAVRVMSSTAQLVVLVVPRVRNDIVAALVGDRLGGDLVGELVGVLDNRYTALTGASLPLEVESGVTSHCELGGRSRSLQLSSGPCSGAIFTHARDVICYHAG